MATITLQIHPQDFEKITNYYQNNLISTPNHAVMAAKTTQATITLYKSGKLLFQGKNAEEAAQTLQQSLNLNSSNISKTTTTNLPNNFSNWNIIGSDEVGNGSYFGPLVVCATYVDKTHIKELTKLGIADSKTLTDSKMQQIAPLIKKLIPYKILVVKPYKYNQIQPDYNAVKMKAVLHNRCLALLEKQLVPTIPDGILIDQFTNENNYLKYIKNETLKPTSKLYMTTKGENKHLSVAAASILARITFLDWFEKTNQELDINLPSGAGHNVDIVASKIINQFGIQKLEHLAKLHFANTKKAMDLAK